jgi:hypothetical protein
VDHYRGKSTRVSDAQRQDRTLSFKCIAILLQAKHCMISLPTYLLLPWCLSSRVDEIQSNSIGEGAVSTMPSSYLPSAGAGTVRRRHVLLLGFAPGRGLNEPQKGDRMQ